MEMIDIPFGSSQLLFQPHPPELIGQEDAKDQHDTLAAKHNTWTQ